MGAALEFLQDDGYVRQVRDGAGVRMEITESGRQALKPKENET